MIIYFIVLVMALLLKRQDERRSMTAFVYIMLTCFHTMIFSTHPDNGSLYFSSAALNDILIILIISNLHNTTELTENLMKINICFIANSGLGWILWMNGIYPSIHQHIAVLLYLLVITSLLSQESTGDGDFKINRWYSFFRLNPLAGNQAFNKLQNEGKH